MQFHRAIHLLERVLFLVLVAYLAPVLPAATEGRQYPAFCISAGPVCALSPWSVLPVRRGLCCIPGATDVDTAATGTEEIRADATPMHGTPAKSNPEVRPKSKAGRHVTDLATVTYNRQTTLNYLSWIKEDMENQKSRVRREDDFGVTDDELGGVREGGYQKKTSEKSPWMFFGSMPETLVETAIRAEWNKIFGREAIQKMGDKSWLEGLGSDFSGEEKPTTPPLMVKAKVPAGDSPSEGAAGNSTTGQVCLNTNLAVGNFQRQSTLNYLSWIQQDMDLAAPRNRRADDFGETDDELGGVREEGYQKKAPKENALALFMLFGSMPEMLVETAIDALPHLEFGQDTLEKMRDTYWNDGLR